MSNLAGEFGRVELGFVGGECVFLGWEQYPRDQQPIVWGGGLVVGSAAAPVAVFANGEGLSMICSRLAREYRPTTKVSDGQ